MIHDVRLTASPAYEIHAICTLAGIPYAHVTESRSSKASIHQTSFMPNKLAYVGSVEILEQNWEGFVDSATPWSIVVHASAEEAGELSLPYAERAHRGWIFQGLLSTSQLVKVMTRKAVKNANKTYLSAVITELYKIQPKEDRPFMLVFRYLAGVTNSVDLDRPGLALAVKAARPIRRAIKALGKDRTMPNIRRVAKALRIDTFEINYTLAKGSVKKLD